MGYQAYTEAGRSFSTYINKSDWFLLVLFPSKIVQQFSYHHGQIAILAQRLRIHIHPELNSMTAELPHVLLELNKIHAKNTLETKLKFKI